MKRKTIHTCCLSFFLLAMTLCSLHGQNTKVFIMAGQSNMQGHGEVSPASVSGTLAHFMGNGGATAFDYVQNEEGDWATREDVWVRYDHEDGDLLAGTLAVGFGSNEEQIGPEYGFGHQLGMQSDDDVLIIKTCWGGKSLAVDFRPPSSGGTTGPFYNQMLSDITAAINNISTEFPQFTGGDIEIAGMAWFQGWNDCDEQAFVDEYEQNLINLISDVRADLNAPNMPFVIGLSGNGGCELVDDPWVNTLQTQIIPSQINAALYDGYENVSYIDTRPFWREGDVSPEPDFLHHWNNNAESYLRIGDALGKAMNTLLGQVSNDDVSNEAYCNNIGQPATTCGLITNGQFEENLNRWWAWGCDASVANGEATFENINADDSGIAQGRLSFDTDEGYTITFDAYAAQARAIEVIVFLDEAPFTEYSREQVNLSTTIQNHELSFTFNEASVTNGAIAFEFNGDDSNVSLDNVCVDVRSVDEPGDGDEGGGEDANPGIFPASGYGFNYFNTEPVSDDSFGAGYSFYAAVWPFMEQYPGVENFQTGQGTWVSPQNAAVPDDFYNTIEGGLGWWGDTRFGTTVPKFIMGGVAHSFDAAANGPGAGSTDHEFDGHRSWDTPGGKYGVAQLSPNLLWPPDGLNMAQGSNGEFLGYGYHPLPLTDPMETTNGVDWQTGNQCWTLFMNAANFKGPAAFFIPTFWASTVLDVPAYEGLFLDSRPSTPNLAFAQEFSASPAVVGVDNTGDVYARIMPPVYPKTTGNSSAIMRDVSVYSRDAKWNDVESWFNGGPVPPTQLNETGTIKVDFAIDNIDAVEVNAAAWSDEGPVVDAFMNQESYAQIKMSADQKVGLFEWDVESVNERPDGFMMPEFYKLSDANLWEAIPMANVPPSSGLLENAPETTPRNDDLSYITPLEPDNHLSGTETPWNSPGPVAGPYTVAIGDGTNLTYYWYRFVDQPSIIHANLPDDMRDALQRRVEMIHTNWSSSDEYLDPPTGGELVGLDPGLIVAPPAGLEVGYVPIVTRQGDRSPTLLPVELIEFSGQLEDKSIRLNWRTANETNNAGFEVQKSNNGIEWEPIGFVDNLSAVTAERVNNYHHVDPTPFPGMNYYRLKQVDQDETFEYSNVITIEYKVPQAAVQVFPNPTKEVFYIDLDNPLGEKVEISVSDNLGRVVLEYENTEGNRRWRREVALKNPGVYFLSTQIGDDVFHEKIVIDR